MQRGSTPRVYRNMLVFLAASTPARQSEGGHAVVPRLGRDRQGHDRLNLTQSDSALAKAKLAEANET
jgi:uncharacterized protein